MAGVVAGLAGLPAEWAPQLPVEEQHSTQHCSAALLELAEKTGEITEMRKFSLNQTKSIATTLIEIQIFPSRHL